MVGGHDVCSRDGERRDEVGVMVDSTVSEGENMQYGGEG